MPFANMVQFAMTGSDDIGIEKAYVIILFPKINRLDKVTPLYGEHIHKSNKSLSFYLSKYLNTVVICLPSFESVFLIWPKCCKKQRGKRYEDEGRKWGILP